MDELDCDDTRWMRLGRLRLRQGNLCTGNLDKESGENA